jgi:AraC family L-rhamnose operon regulatory protein RhaS
MKPMQTIGREIYKNAVFEIYSTKELFVLDGSDPSMFQLMYVDEGSVIIADGGSEEAFFAPVMLCINYREPVSSLTLSNVKGFSVFFRPEVINHGLAGVDVSETSPDRFRTEQILFMPFLRGKKGNPFVLRVNGSIRNRLLRMNENLEFQLFNQPDDNWPCRGRSFFLEMLMLLQSMSNLELEGASSTIACAPEFYPVIREIHVRYPEPEFRPTALARENNMPSFLFSHRFKKSVGVSPDRYVSRLRCSVGANLLKNTMLAVPEIARRCGYPDDRRFSADFAHLQGVDPNVWRAQFPNPYGG